MTDTLVIHEESHWPHQTHSSTLVSGNMMKEHNIIVFSPLFCWEWWNRNQFLFDHEAFYSSWSKICICFVFTVTNAMYFMLSWNKHVPRGINVTMLIKPVCHITGQPQPPTGSISRGTRGPISSRCEVRYGGKHSLKPQISEIFLGQEQEMSLGKQMTWGDNLYIK